MKISENQYGALVLGPFLITLILAILFTPWQTSELEKLNTDKGFDTESIRGWMTIQEVSDESGINIDELYRVTEIPITIKPETPLKDIKIVVEGFEVDTVRIAIDNYEAYKSEPQFQCPYGIVHDPAPGLCGFYADNDLDRECDYQLK